MREKIRERARVIYDKMEKVPVLEEVFIRLDGTEFPAEVSAVPIYHNGEKSCLVFIRDITERKEAEKAREKAEQKHKMLESQLHQAQKMESVGRLAGGIAHDYNNMLSVITGYTELALGKVDRDDPLFEDLNEILSATRRSAEITRQLLAFARKQTVSPRVLDLNSVVGEMLKTIRRLIGEDINLEWHPVKELWHIKMDPSQADQILANLCVNARDAIAGVGSVTIATCNTVFDSAYCEEHRGYYPGEYIQLTVSDNGCGMDKKTLELIFEPFFTTKEIGHGTGLGLATVYGIVKQNSGFINVYSEPDRGTTFSIYLPRCEEAHEDKNGIMPDDIPPGKGETILLVEDEPAILQLGIRMLAKLGYQVLPADTPPAALETAASHSGKINLLVTDVVMPEMNGKELALKIRSFFPDIRILFMSGYTANVIEDKGILEEGLCFMQKPFSLREMAVKVREALEKRNN